MEQLMKKNEIETTGFLVSQYIGKTAGCVQNEKGIAMRKAVPEEWRLKLLVNGKLIVKIMCTPSKLNELAAGFLYCERIIDSCDDIVSLKINEDEHIAIANLKHTVNFDSAPVLLSGFGGGISSIDPEHIQYDRKSQILEDDSPMLTSDEIISVMEHLKTMCDEYKKSGGIHFSALYRDGEVLAFAEDIGRHNTMDKVIGEALLTGRQISGATMFTSGRVSSEMLLKCQRCGVKCVCSLSSPTDLAIATAKKHKIHIFGYVKDSSCILFA